MGLITSIVWVLTIIAMGIAYAIIMNEKPKNKDEINEDTQDNSSVKQKRLNKSSKKESKETTDIK